MPKYIVRSVYKSIEEDVVEAESEEEALEIASRSDGQVVDFYLYDSSAKLVKE